MKPTQLILFLLTLTILSCRMNSSTQSSVKIINPNSIKGLAPKFSKVKPSIVEVNESKVTMGGLYLSKKQISVEEYFIFIQDMARGIPKEALKDSLSLYIDLAKSPIRLSNDQVITTSSRKNKPMNYVSYFGAEAYCHWLSSHYCDSLDIPRFRLPSEYEWIAAFNQQKIHNPENSFDWTEESTCVETYRPFVRKACVVNWFSPYPDAIPDSALVKSVLGGEHYTLGHCKAKVDSSIGFRVAQTKLMNTSYEF